MKERTRDFSPEITEKIQIPTSTLPPENKTRESGRYRMRTFLTRMSPEQLREPQNGGIILNALEEWDNRRPEIKKEIMTHMLNYIAHDPIPSDEEISAEIVRSSARAEITIKVRDLLNTHENLPRVIKTAILSDLEDYMQDHPQDPPEEVTGRAQDLLQAALLRIDGAAKTNAGRYSYIAWEVIREINERKREKDGVEEIESDTMPETPEALRGRFPLK